MPHCNKITRALVLETRTSGDAIYRRRVCGACGKTFVSRESTSPDLRLPRERTAAEKAARAAAKRLTSDKVRGDGAHLDGVWR